MQNINYVLEGILNANSNQLAILLFLGDLLLVGLLTWQVFSVVRNNLANKEAKLAVEFNKVERQSKESAKASEIADEIKRNQITEIVIAIIVSAVAGVVSGVITTIILKLLNVM